MVCVTQQPLVVSFESSNINSLESCMLAETLNLLAENLQMEMGSEEFSTLVEKITNRELTDGKAQIAPSINVATIFDIHDSTWIPVDNRMLTNADVKRCIESLRRADMLCLSDSIVENIGRYSVNSIIESFRIFLDSKCIIISRKEETYA